MSIIFHYIFRQAAAALLLILFSLGGVVWIALALKQLNVVTSQGQDALLLLKMTTLALPNLLAVVAPFALLIAVMHTLSRLNTDSELIVLTASGATVWEIAKPLLLLGFIVAAAVAFVNHVGMPWSLKQLKLYVLQMRTDLLTQVIQPGRFSSPERGLTFHIRERAPNGDLLGLIVNDTRKSKEQQSYLAEHARIIKQDDTAYIVMTTGHILRRTNPKAPAEIIAFDNYAVDLDRFDKKSSGSIQLKPRERYLHELIEPRPDDDEIFKEQRGHMRAELHERFSNPLYPIAFILIALATAGQAQSTRQNRMERTIVGFVAATGCRLAGLAVNNLIVVNSAFVPLLYALPIFAAGLAVVVIFRNAQPRKGPTWIEYVLDPVFDRIAILTSRIQSLRGRGASSSLQPAQGHPQQFPPGRHTQQTGALEQ